MTQRQAHHPKPQSQDQHPDLIKDFQPHGVAKYQWPWLLNPDVTNPYLKWMIGSKLIIPVVGLFGKFWMNVLNKSTVYNAQIFLDTLDENYFLVKSSKPRRPVITYCNHTSCMDDPLIWGSLMPLNWLLNSDRQRWTSAAVEICFGSKFYTTFFSLGKTFPMARGEGIYQPAMNYASRLMQNGYWLHFFPEGKVIPRPENGDPSLLKFNLDEYYPDKDQSIKKSRNYSLKWGMARLIIEHVLREGENKDKEYSKIISSNQFSMDRLPESNQDSSAAETLPEVDILPMYHIGMDEVLPTRKPYIPRMFCRVTFLVRPEGPIRIDKNFLMKLFYGEDAAAENRPKPFELTLTEKRIRLMRFLENELNILAEKTRMLHFCSASSASCSSPQQIKSKKQTTMATNSNEV